MNRFSPVSFMLISTLVFQASAAKQAVSDYEEVRGQIRVNEQVGREVMARLYEINSRMKRVSRQRTLMQDKTISTEARIRKLTNTTQELNETILVQRKRLARRLRAIYMLGQDKMARAIFSAGNSADLQQTIKFLKLFSDQDYHLIRTYESNLAILKRKHEALDRELRHLVGLRRQLGDQEKLLDADQISKTRFLSDLNLKKGQALKRLNSIKRELGAEAANALDLSFFEQKGKLKAPLGGRVVRGFGIIEDQTYGYQLSHKGLLYVARVPSAVTVVHAGRIVYAGQLDGYGKTVIVDHGDHYYSVYSGLEAMKVANGQAVATGAVISERAKNLYFELRHFSDAIDPKHWLLNERGES